MAAEFLVHVAISFVMIFFTAYASDPNMLQDFCVTANDPNHTTVFVNGFVCKNPSEVTSDDFVFRGINETVFNDDQLGLRGTLVGASNLPGLNTMGISVTRLEYAPNGGLSPPHVHPRSSEILTVLEGTLYAGFVTGANKLYSKILNQNDVFVFPQGLVHFHSNIGKTKAVSILALGSQNPGAGPLVDKLFGTDPPIKVDVLSKSFQLDPKIVEELQSKF